MASLKFYQNLNSIEEKIVSHTNDNQQLSSKIKSEIQAGDSSNQTHSYSAITPTRANLSATLLASLTYSRKLHLRERLQTMHRIIKDRSKKGMRLGLGPDCSQRKGGISLQNQLLIPKELTRLTQSLAANASA